MSFFGRLFRRKVESDENWLTYAPMQFVCGHIPGLCENPGHHMEAIRLERLLREAYERGQRSRTPAKMEQA